MTNTKDQRKKKKTQGMVALPRLCVFFSRTQPTTNIGSKSDSYSGETWALVWNTKRGRRQTIVLVALLSRDRQLEKYKETLETLKLEAKKVGCTRLTDSLDIVKIKPGQHHDDPTLWWPQLFDNDTPSETDLYQWVRFGLDGKGQRINYQFTSTNIKSDTQWSLILDVLNNCDSIEEIVQSGRIPNAVSEDKLKVSSLHEAFAASNDRSATKDGSEKNGSFLSPLSVWRQTSFSNNSITTLHLRNFHSMHIPYIPMIRCLQAFVSLWNNHNNVSRKNEVLRTNHRSIIPSQIELSKERITRWNAFLSAFFDMLLGFVVCALLVHLLCNPQNLGEALNLNLSVKKKAFQHLEENIAWLETFPAGFKLNVQLTHTMGRGIRSLLDRYKGVLLATIWDPKIRRDFLVPVLAAIAGLGGWTTFLAFVLDLWRLEIFHFTILAVCFRKLYQVELFLLSALFRLFRGKKRNVLRQRTDSMKYDAMQLLVGTIAFCVCVFLWTTIMVYYTFFLICNLSMHLPLMGFSMLYLLSRSFPFGSLLFRVFKSHWFPRNLYIQTRDEIIIHAHSNVSIQVGDLVSVLESPASILSGRTGAPLGRLLNWYLVSSLEIVRPRSGHKLHSFLPSTLLVDGSKT